MSILKKLQKILRMNLFYFRNPEPLLAPCWLLPVFSYTAQIQNLTHTGIQHFCHKTLSSPQYPLELWNNLFTV